MSDKSASGASIMILDEKEIIDVDALETPIENPPEGNKLNLDSIATKLINICTENNAQLDTKINDDDKDGSVSKRVGRRYFHSEDENIICYNCKCAGHIAAQCIEAKPLRPCTICAGINHERSHCSQFLLCYRCHQMGHSQKDCVFPRHQRCSRCLQFGHTTKNCTEFISIIHLERNRISCYNCGKRGHSGDVRFN